MSRALGLGGRHLDIGQGPDEGHVVLADPEGNEFCVIEPGNSFLAGCGFLGELSLRRLAGGRVLLEPGAGLAVGLGPGRGDRDPVARWRYEDHLGWSAGGAKTTKNRLHLDIAPPADADQQAEVERLVSLGASRVDIGQGDVSWVVMADPGGNEFCVLTPR